MESTLLHALPLLVLLLGHTSFGAADTSSCMVRLFMKSGLSQPRAVQTEKNLIAFKVSPKDIGRTPSAILALLLKTSADETQRIQACIMRKSDACQKLVACQNGGKCVLEDSAKLYTCRCNDNFKGSFCELFNGLAGAVQRLGLKVDTVLTELQALDTKVDDLAALHIKPPVSCKEIKMRNSASGSGSYEIRTPLGKKIKVYCEMDREGGGWTRVLHMDPATSGVCPGALRAINPGLKLCTRNGGQCGEATVKSVTGAFTEVMGFVTGYKYRTTDGFSSGDIEGAYLDGVSVTRGSPKKHLWSYVSQSHCSCTARSAFVGSHFYCSDSIDHGQKWTLNQQGRMWSGTDPCRNACCKNDNKPWFVRKLGGPTIDDIHVRVCLNQDTNDEDIGIDHSDIYVR